MLNKAQAMHIECRIENAQFRCFNVTNTTINLFLDVHNKLVRNILRFPGFLNDFDNLLFSWHVKYQNR